MQEDKVSDLGGRVFQGIQLDNSWRGAADSLVQRDDLLAS